MNGIIALSIILIAASLAAFAIYRVTRPSTAVPPRRRELNRVRTANASAQEALAEIQRILDSYGSGLDVVGVAMSTDLRNVIGRHDRKMREIA